MEKRQKCKRCWENKLLFHFMSIRNSKRHGIDMGPWKLFETCSKCRVKKNSKSRATYKKKNKDVRSRGPQKDLRRTSFLLSMSESDWNLFFVKRFEEDCEENEMNKDFFSSGPQKDLRYTSYLFRTPELEKRLKEFTEDYEENEFL